MKKAVLFFTVLFVSSFVYCQKIKEETVSLLKDKRPCLVAEYDIPSEVLENVVEDYLSKEGLKKPSSKSGFKLYEKAIYAKISNDAMDYYIKVDGNKEKSKVIVVISKGYENFITISEGGIYSNFKDVLKNFQEVGYKAWVDEQIKEQQKVVEKAQKKYDKLVEEGKDLVKEKENIENKIQRNKSDQEGAKTQLEEEQRKLKSIK